MITAAGVVRDTRLPRDRFGRSTGRVRAVDGLNLHVESGELLGIVGPQGAGKATIASLVTGRLAPDAGTITYRGTDLKELIRKDRDAVREELQLIGPGADTLGRRQPVGEILTEAATAGAARGAGGDPPAPADLLAQVGLDGELGDKRFGRLTTQQRARVGLARVVALNPALVVLDLDNGSLPADERRWALDVLLRLRAEAGTALIVLAAEIADVSMCEHLLITYLGRVVEVLEATDLPAEALHPYSHALLAAVGSGAAGSAQATMKGRPLPPGERPSGCGFRTRCFRAQDLCADEVPQLTRPLGATHPVACHFPQRWSSPGSAGTPDRGQSPRDGDRPEPTAQEFAEG